MTEFVSWLKNLVSSGSNVGWQSFGQSSGFNSNEQGQDFGMPWGTKVPAPVGTVTAITPWKEGESLVTIDLGGGRSVSIGHLFPFVHVGQVLNGSETLGTSGGNALQGYSSGPHIEVQTRNNGTLQNPIPWITSLKKQPTIDTQGVITPVTVPPLLALPDTLQTLVQQAQSAVSSDVSASPLATIAGDLGMVKDWVTNGANWWRVLFVLLGILMVGTGVVLYVVGD